MKTTETKFSEKEIRKVKNKYWKSMLVNTITLLMFGIPFFLSNKNRTNYNFSIILFNIIFGLILIIMLLNLIGIIISLKDLRRDIQNKIKIKTQIRIKEKRELNHTDSDNFNYNTTYRLLFESNDFLTVYDVKKNDFNKVKEGDLIDIECSKFSKWIIKIEWNSISIDNKNYLK
ncbi:MAG: hypothetical protein ABFR05_13410 [Bacteroidota bacterium]